MSIRETEIVDVGLNVQTVLEQVKLKTEPQMDRLILLNFLLNK